MNFMKIEVSQVNFRAAYLVSAIECNTYDFSVCNVCFLHFMHQNERQREREWNTIRVETR